jgi:TRAP-type C4-dicarboxylate transport system permease small subunit
MFIIRWINTLLSVLDRVIGWSAGICLLIITGVLFVNSMARYFAGIAFIGGEELARLLMVWLTFLGSYLLVRIQGHVTVDILPQVMPPLGLRILIIAVGLVGAVTMVWVARIGWDLAIFIMSTDQMMSSLPIRRGWLYFSIPIGTGLMAVAYAMQVLLALTNQPFPRSEDFGMASPDKDADVPPNQNTV